MRRLVVAHRALWLLLWLLPAAAPAADIDLSKLKPSQPIGPQLDFLVDAAHRFKVSDIARGDHDDAFFSSTKLVPQFTAVEETYWARFTLRNPGSAPVDRVLVIEFPNLLRMSLFQPDDSDGYRERVSNVFTRQRDVDIRYRHPAFHLRVPAASTQTYFVRINSPTARFSLTLWEPDAFTEHASLEPLPHGLMLGIILCALAYHLVVSLLTGDRHHRVMFGFALSVLVAMFCMYGYHHLYFGSAANYLSRSYFQILALMTVAVTISGRSFLELHQTLPRMDRIMRGLQWLFVAIMVIAYFAQPPAQKLAYYAIVFGVFCLLGSATKLALRGHTPAKLFLLSWLPIIAGGGYAILTGLGVFSLYPGYQTVLGFCFTLGVLLFSLFTANRVRQQQADSEQLARQMMQAQAVAKTQSAFLATMSHEIRTPLNGIMGMTALLQKTPLNQQQHRYTQAIGNAGESLLTLVNQVLDFSRLESAKAETHLAAFALHELLQQTADQLIGNAHQKGLALVVEIADSVPDVIRSDADKLRQILLNLIGNAIKFTEQGSVTLRADYATDRDSPRLRIEVIDTGIGVDEGERERIFERFQQADSSISRRFGGSGLGLAISKRLAMLLHGEIGMTGTPGAAGSCFWLEIPAPSDVLNPPRTSAPAPDLDLEVAPAKAIDTTPTTALNILLADDNPINLELAEEQLRTAGHRVKTATDGHAALQLFAMTAFDLLLIDISMPGLDGLQLTHKIRHLPDPVKAAVPIIALTANAFPEDREAYLAAGINAVLTKPLRAETLNQALEAASTTHGPAADTTAQSESALLNTDKLQEHIALMGRDRLNQLVRRQQRDTHASLATIATAIELRDLSEVERCSHQLLGICAYLGFDLMHTRAHRLNHAAREGNIDQLQQLFAELRAAWRQTDQAITQGMGAVAAADIAT